MLGKAVDECQHAPKIREARYSLEEATMSFGGAKDLWSLEMLAPK